MFPKLFSHGDFFLPTYGLMVALAFLVAIWLTSRLAVKAGLKPDLVVNLGIYCALAGMIGGKLGMFLFDWKTYWDQPSLILSRETMQAMGVYQTGLILALITAVGYMKMMDLPPLRTCDVFAPGLALGHGIGRLGCFAAGCCWGQACQLPWAVTFRNPDAERLTGVPLGIPLHPTQLYESAAEFLIFAWLYRRFHQSHRPGAIIGQYLILYSVVRFLVEFVRNHEQGLMAGLSLTQWISLGTLGLGVLLVFRGADRQPVTP
ncbi:MAG TPA: prolipoprotein diacylglyceryl transferase [Bryobacteraceae bacterium]|nr:prolipoprotein diacylglyceryl transferase [Bryobacteraceae bacterium]